MTSRASPPPVLGRAHLSSDRKRFQGIRAYESVIPALANAPASFEAEAAEARRLATAKVAAVPGAFASSKASPPSGAAAEEPQQSPAKKPKL